MDNTCPECGGEFIGVQYGITVLDERACVDCGRWENNDERS